MGIEDALQQGLFTAWYIAIDYEHVVSSRLSSFRLALD